MTDHSESPDHFVGPLAIRIGKWADRLLMGFIERNPVAPTARKQIHDPLGKIIELEPWEVYILNSPLLQRLRYVRQLGVGHYLFPTAGYSRFEHSLGALHTATLMFDSVINAKDDLGASSAPPLTSIELQQQRAVIRIAALLHDVGHCLFSHVSESFYKKHPDVREARDFFRAQYDQGSITASETISLIILQSAAFTRLVQAAGAQRVGLGDQSLISQAALCIAGSANRMIPYSYLAEIINGSVDCDKLDYLARDAHMAGVPIQLDVTRLLSKLRVAAKTIDDEGPHEGKTTWSLAIVPSGARALDELQVARIFLYDKFYYHHKVMAAEELIRRGLSYLTKADPRFRDPALLLEFGDDQFLSLTPAVVEALFGISATNPSVIAGCQFLERARNRQLPRRVFGFASRFLPDQLPLVAQFETKGRNAIFAEDMRKYHFRTITRILKTPEGAAKYTSLIRDAAAELNADTEIYVALQSAKRAAGSMYLPVLRADGQVDDKPSYLFKNAEWTEAYALNKATSYVFADAPSPEVHLAAERVFAERQLIFAPNSWIAAKISEDALNQRRKTLADTWIESRLPPNYLKSHHARKMINRAERKFAAFLASIDEEFGPPLVQAWVSQFPDADMQDSALRLLDHIKYVGAADLVKAFENFADGDVVLRNAVWVPFRPWSGGGTSADQLLVDLKDSKLQMQSISGVTADEIRNAGAVVFFDDTLNSGVQCSCLLSSWFGADETCENSEDRDPHGALNAELMAALRAVPIFFAVYAKHPTGDARLRALASRLSLQLRDVLGVIQSGDPQYTLEGFHGYSATSTARFIDYLEDRGKRLLRAKIGTKPSWDQQRVQRSALGYSSIHLTIVFRHSISTATPVALWAMNTDYEDQWIPVFPRKREELRQILRVDKPQNDQSSEVPEYEGS
ncbi:MAG TPA: HD domain-containing protein [Gemmatimonadaceae bacterium]|jgi:hypothetical protein